MLLTHDRDYHVLGMENYYYLGSRKLLLFQNILDIQLCVLIIQNLFIYITWLLRRITRSVDCFSKQLGQLSLQACRAKQKSYKPARDLLESEKNEINFIGLGMMEAYWNFFLCRQWISYCGPTLLGKGCLDARFNHIFKNLKFFYLIDFWATRPVLPPFNQSPLGIKLDFSLVFPIKLGSYNFHERVQQV